MAVASGGIVISVPEHDRDPRAVFEVRAVEGYAKDRAMAERKRRVTEVDRVDLIT
jgi:hypothetical protein